jgi:DNA modification methylase
MIDLRLGDCLEVMKTIPNKSIDAIITDPPYGTTACKWDSVIDFDLMWEQLNRIIKPNGAILLFGSEPFSSALRMSNIKNYKYDWMHNYYPIKEEREGGGKQRQKYKYNNGKIGDFIGMKNKTVLHTEELRYPSSVQKFNNKAKGDLGKHPTQKPLALMEYLIKTYTNENETVLDFTMGSGTTMVACQNYKQKWNRN